jgi:hypothetical protein
MNMSNLPILFPIKQCFGGDGWWQFSFQKMTQQFYLHTFAWFFYPGANVIASNLVELYLLYSEENINLRINLQFFFYITSHRDDFYIE